MEQVVLVSNQLHKTIAVIREVAAWGRQTGFRVWPDEWLTPEGLVTEESQPENFYVGMVGNEIACAFILQWSDSEYWPNAPKYEAAYLHKFCVRRKFAGKSMTKNVVKAIMAECTSRGIRYIRLDTALDEKRVRKIYLDAGFHIVDIIDYDNGRSMALYELDCYKSPCKFSPPALY